MFIKSYATGRRLKSSARTATNLHLGRRRTATTRCLVSENWKIMSWRRRSNSSIDNIQTLMLGSLNRRIHLIIDKLFIQ